MITLHETYHETYPMRINSLNWNEYWFWLVYFWKIKDVDFVDVTRLGPLPVTTFHSLHFCFPRLLFFSVVEIFQWATSSPNCSIAVSGVNEKLPIVRCDLLHGLYQNKSWLGVDDCLASLTCRPLSLLVWAMHFSLYSTKGFLFSTRLGFASFQ